MTIKELSITKILSITLLFTILFTGALSISPAAFSTGYDDDDHDDCDDDHHSKYDDDDDSGHHSDDDDDDCEPDPCDCKKPDEFIVTYEGPGSEENPAVVEIYKKTDKIGEKDPIVDGITVWNGDNEIVLTASDFGKKKIGSNTGYRILWDDPADDPDAGLVQIAAIDIHTSCSQELYIGQTFTDSEVTLTVQDGKRNGKTSIPISDPLTCEEPPEPPKKGFITLKKALTSDNTSDLKSLQPSDFQLFIQNVEPGSMPILINELRQEVDAGTYTIHETMPVPAEGDPVYSFVLITGDTACPAMLQIDDTVSPLDLSDEFTIQPKKHVTCTIYNDDEGDGSTGGTGGTGDAGIIFDFGFLEFVPVDTLVGACDGTLVFPCIEDRAGPGFLVIPQITSTTTLDLTTTTLILLTVQDVTNLDRNIDCYVSGVEFHTSTGKNGFIMVCSGLDGMTETDLFSANFAFIETDRTI